MTIASCRLARGTASARRSTGDVLMTARAPNIDDETGLMTSRIHDQSTFAEELAARLAEHPDTRRPVTLLQQRGIEAEVLIPLIRRLEQELGRERAHAIAARRSRRSRVSRAATSRGAGPR
jgi:hypothetical protein